MPDISAEQKQAVKQQATRTGPLGFVTCDEVGRGGGVRVSEFQRGYMHYDANTQRLRGMSSTGALALLDRGRF